jgi:hypothetical protein
MQHQQSHRSEIDKIGDRVSDIENLLARKDLTRMLKHAEGLLVELDRELVNCRRLHRYTNEYDRLEGQLLEQLRQTSKWLTMALLKF